MDLFPPSRRRWTRRRLTKLLLAAGGGGLLPYVPGPDRWRTELLAAAALGQAERVEAAIATYLAGAQVLTDGLATWEVPRRALGLSLRPAASVGQLAELAREGVAALLQATVDVQRLAATIVQQSALWQPPVDARLVLRDTTPEVVPPRDGRKVDLDDLARRLEGHAERLDDDLVHLHGLHWPPAVTAADLAETADWLGRGLARPPRVLAGTVEQALDPAALAGALILGPGASVVPDLPAWGQLIQPLAVQIERPTTPARWHVVGQRVMVTAGRPGRQLDVANTAAATLAAMRQGLPTVTAPVQETTPERSFTALQPLAATVERALAAPPTLVAGHRRWRPSPSDLAALIQDDDHAIGLEPSAAARLLAAADLAMATPGSTAVHGWSPGTPTTAGGPPVRLDWSSATAVIRRGLTGGQTTIVLPTAERPSPAPPAVPLFRHCLGQVASSFADSTPDRAANVSLGAERIGGTLIPPDGVFSFNRATGPVTLASGFRRGYGIGVSNGRVTTVPSVGGGICQVATAVFQAAFLAGLRIQDRAWHSYWIARYALPPHGYEGLDAAVDDQTGLDLTFQNTTGSWLWLQATAAAGQITVGLWGLPTGWHVDIRRPMVSDLVRTTTSVEERQDPTLPRGERRWVEHAEDGRRVAVRRSVTDARGRLLDERTFVAWYQPAHNVVLVGTGASAPVDADATKRRASP